MLLGVAREESVFSFKLLSYALRFALFAFIICYAATREAFSGMKERLNEV